MNTIKTRFAPSPTGYLHVGGARTALFNYLVARRSGGKFLLRIEDTDRARHDETAIAKIVDDLRWLGIEWDEGVEIGGPNGPYCQSERLETYREYVQKLVNGGRAYYAFETPDELEALRARAQQQKVNFRYPRPQTFPTTDDAERARREGRPVVVRLAVPGKDVTIQDDAFGEVTTPAEQTDDFIILKADGFPTYHLANVVDDALMGVTYVMRGQEFLGQTWRHAVLREAFREVPGEPGGSFAEPGYCHLPLIMDMQGRKLSKRDGDVEVHSFRQAGYLPEALVNFLALLGWRPGGNQEKITLDQLVELFGVDRIGKSNAKFDRDKLLAFNTDAISEAEEDRLLAAFQDYLSLNETSIPSDDEDLLRHVVRCNRGAKTLADIPARCGVLFIDDEDVEYDPKSVKKVLAKNESAGFAVLGRARDELADVEWAAEALEAWMNAFAERMALGMGKIAQPLRVAVTGTNISPPIFDTLLLLGKDKTLARIDRCLQRKDPQTN
jgi:glutamyl-tRNA synthetase